MTVTSGTTVVLPPCDKRAGLRYHVVRLDFDTERAVQDGYRRDGHIASNDDSSGALIHHDASGYIRLDLDSLDLGDEFTAASPVFAWGPSPAPYRCFRPARWHLVHERRIVD